MFISLILLWICVFFFILCLKCQRPKNFPPGLTPLPILGNLLNLSLDNPMKDFERLKKNYGNVYSLFLGPRPAVVINGVKAMKEAMVTKAADFAGRPQDIFVSDLTRKGVILADYGATWKEHCCFVLMTLRDFGLGKQFMEQRILGEIQYTVETLEKSIGTTLNPQVMFHNVSSNIICQVLMGTRYDYDENFIKVVVQCFKENSKIANAPWAMAVIHEVQRMANTVPLSVYHSTTNDTELMGYFLPRGTLIIQNMSSVLNEKGQWKSPHEFNPENFLNDQGDFVKPEAFLPFSAEGLARIELFLIMVTLLRKFKFIWPEDVGQPDYIPVYGVTLSPKDYHMKVQHRATQ